LVIHSGGTSAFAREKLQSPAVGLATIELIQSFGDPFRCAARVRLWPKADIQASPVNVRFRVNSGHRDFRASCLLLTQSGHGERRFDHFQPDSLTRYDPFPDRERQ
jgi:hypothetical protein